MSSTSRAARLLVLAVLGVVSITAGCARPLAPEAGDPPPPEVPPGEHTGTLPDGATWRAVVPEDWNGTLLLYGHGYTPGFFPGPNGNPLAPGAEVERTLLAEGYAVAASSYEDKGWVVETAARDQRDALAAAIDAIGAQPDRVLAYGTSMGGLVTGQLAENPGDRDPGERDPGERDADDRDPSERDPGGPDADDRDTGGRRRGDRPAIDGALTTCGLMSGGVGLVDHQLDGAHAIAQLLAPGQDLDLVGYESAAEASAAASALQAAVDAGQETPEGRARVALAAALFHLPRRPSTGPAPEPGDWDAIQRALHDWLDGTLGFVVPARADIESAVGGNPSANVGVDYRHLFRRSADRDVVEALYRQAGLDLGADLDRLTATAATQADPAARDRLQDTATVSGRLAVPVLSFHTTTDNLAPVQFEEEYREEVTRAGRRRSLRQAFVDRAGHCAFTPAELVAGIHALEQRVVTGRWGDVARADRLDAEADALGLGDADFVEFRPGEFLGDRPVGGHGAGSDHGLGS